jgi:hypothetical protein
MNNKIDKWGKFGFLSMERFSKKGRRGMMKILKVSRVARNTSQYVCVRLICM